MDRIFICYIRFNKTYVAETLPRNSNSMHTLECPLARCLYAGRAIVKVS